MKDISYICSTFQRRRKSKIFIKRVRRKAKKFYITNGEKTRDPVSLICFRFARHSLLSRDAPGEEGMTFREYADLSR